MLSGVEVVVKAVGGADFIDSPEHALVQQLLSLRHCRQVELVVGAHQRHARCTDSRPHLVGLLHSQAERLFTQDVFACLSSSHDCLGVEMVRQADVDGVELGLQDHLPEVGVRRRVQLGRTSAGRLIGYIGDGGHFDGIGVGTVAPNVSVNYAPATHEANLDRAHAATIG